MVNQPSNQPNHATGRGPPGQFIDGYQIVELLGQGGMGAVYRVCKDRRDYALKVMLKGALDATDLAHFQREAQATAAIRHPHVIAVHTLKLEGPTPYILFDYVRGQSLDQFLSHPWTLEEALTFLRPIAEALDHVHEQGLVHRDLKPANIMVREHDRSPLLADFGLARGGDLDSLTQTGAVKGTPAYMAPEQFQGMEVDGRTDQWAFAVMLYELLTGGERPFQGETPMALASAAMLKEAPSIFAFQEEVPETIDQAFSKALAKDKEDRYESVTEFLDDCERAMRGEALEGKVPLGFKGALRSFRRGGARSALKLLILVFLFSGSLGGSWWLWTRQQKQKIVSELGPDFTEKQFQADFEAELGRRLLEKYTGTETPIVRPDYLLPTSHYQAKKDELRSLSLGKGETAELVMKLHQKLQCSQSWDQLQELRRKNCDRFIGKDPREVEWLTDKFSRPYRGHLLAAFAFFSERWEDAYKQFRKVSGKTKSGSVVLGQGLSAFKSRQYRATAEALRNYHEDLGADVVKALLFEAVHRAKAERFLEMLDSRPLKELKGVLEQVCSSGDPKAWTMVNETIQQALKETPRALENSEKKVLRKYRQLDELRLFYPQLKPWPLTEPLLQSLMKDAEQKKYTKLVWLYSVLLHELNPKAKLSKDILMDDHGRPALAAIENVIQAKTRLSDRKILGSNLARKYDWLNCFGRHGILLPFFSQQGLGGLRERGLLKGEERDPVFRLWRGLAANSESWDRRFRRVKSRIRDQRLRRPPEEARKLWAELQPAQKDILYALKFGDFNKCFQALAKRRLAMIWFAQAELRMTKKPVQLRDRGLEFLEPIVVDHPFPYKVVQTISFLQQVARPWSDYSRRALPLIDRREKLLRWQFEELAAIRMGKRRAAIRALLPMSKQSLKSKLLKCKVSRAYAYRSIERVEEAYRIFEEAMLVEFSVTDFRWFLGQARLSKNLKEARNLKRILEKSTAKQLKSRDTEERKQVKILFQQINKLIRDLASQKN